MVKGLTTLKVILPLLLLLSACSEKPASTDTQTENNTQKSASSEATIKQKQSPTIQQGAAIKPATKPSIAVIQGDSNVIKEEISQDYSDRKIEVLDIAERSFDGGNAIAVT